MKKSPLLVAIACLILAAAASAETAEPQTAAATSPETVAQPVQPQLSDNPKMKAEGQRLAALMEKLQKESDPDERRKIMSEAMCPQ